MTYQEFTKYLIQNLKNYMKDEDIRQLCIKRFPIPNEMQDIITLEAHKDDIWFYGMMMQDAYDMYLKSNDLDETMEEIADELDELIAFGFPDDVQKLEQTVNNRDYILSHVTLGLINPSFNKMMLKIVPSQPFIDLIMVCNLIIDNNNDAISTIITNDMIKKHSITKNELFEHAKKNTKEQMQLHIGLIQTLLANAFKDTEPQGILKILAASQLPMIMLTNQYNINGAYFMTDNNTLKPITDKLQDDIYLLPVSLDSIIAIPTSIIDAKTCRTILHEINKSEYQDINSLLTDNLYRYHRDLNATGVVVLDGMLQEKQ